MHCLSGIVESLIFKVSYSLSFGETEFDAYSKYHYCSYSQQVEVFIDSFNYSIEKRGNYDFWNVSLTLEEA